MSLTTPTRVEIAEWAFAAQVSSEPEERALAIGRLVAALQQALEGNELLRRALEVERRTQLRVVRPEVDRG